MLIISENNTKFLYIHIMSVSFIKGAPNLAQDIHNLFYEKLDLSPIKNFTLGNASMHRLWFVHAQEKRHKPVIISKLKTEHGEHKANFL